MLKNNYALGCQTMKPFFKEVLKSLAVSTVSTVVFALLAFMVLGAVISALLNEKEVRVEKDSFLVLNLSMNLTERPNGFRLDDLTRQALTNQGQPPQFHLLEVIRALDRASGDEKIKGVFIEGSFAPSGYGCGYQTILELIDALKFFKESGKAVIGFCHSPSQLDYLVYSVCDELHMDPSGTLLLNGLASEDFFIGETLEKYGVGMQVLKTGEYKGAVEPLTSTGFSEENREQIKRVLDLRWKHFLGSIVANRSLSASIEDLNGSLSQDFFLDSAQSLERGLVDFVSPYDRLMDILAERGRINKDSKEFSRVSLLKYVDRSASDPRAEKVFSSDKKVAVVYVEGAIVDGRIDDGLSAGGNEIAARVREIRNDSDFKALVLRVNSPGGSVSGSDVILSEIRRARKDGLPVVVSMGSVAASGGYWISTESDRIFAGEQTITGSIGVFGLLPNLKELGSRFGVYWDVVKTHDSSDVMSISRPKTEEEIEVIGDYVAGIYERFLELVAKSRLKEVSEIEKIARGRVWLGEDARQNGLIDEFGGLVNAIEHAARSAGLKSYEVVEYPRVETSLEVFSKAFGMDPPKGGLPLGSSDPGFDGLLRNFDKVFGRLRGLNDPRHAYALLPWYSSSFGF